jgi:membrane fusion protein, multidrug efflux system
LLGIVLTLAGCGAHETKRRSQAVSVSATPVVSRPIPFELEATGTVEPQQTVEVLAQIGGTLRRVAFREGDAVRQGQVLFQLDDRPFRAALDQARAVLARDRAQAEKTRREAERGRKLREEGVISAGEDDDKQAAADALEATVRADEAAAAQARLNLLHATIEAPISGRTGRLSSHVGDVVKPSDSGNPLVTINQMHPVRVRFTVPQDAMGAVLRGRDRHLRVLVSPADQDTFVQEGRLAFIDNSVDAATGTLMLKGEFANPNEILWPGEFVRVRLVLDSDPSAVVVPSVAVTAGPSGSFVYVLGADSTVSVRPVVVQRTHEELSVIASGVQPGEVVVTDGQLRLGPGSKVAIRPPAGSGTPPGGSAPRSGARAAQADGREQGGRKSERGKR